MVQPDWIEKISHWAASQPDIVEVFLSGSRAKGTAKPESDLDIGVVIRSDDPEEDVYTLWFFNADQWRAELAALVPVKVDLQTADPEISTDVVAPAVKAHGMGIFARQSGWTTFAS
jgi:predicted nucleotidyltransferase